MKTLCEKSIRWLWKENCVSTGVRKARKHMCVTDRNDMTLNDKVIQSINQSLKALSKREKLLVKRNSQQFSTLVKNFPPCSSNFILSSANSFSLEQSKLCRSGKDLRLQARQHSTIIHKSSLSAKSALFVRISQQVITRNKKKS